MLAMIIQKNTSNGARGAKMIFPSGQSAGFTWIENRCVKRREGRKSHLASSFLFLSWACWFNWDIRTGSFRNTDAIPLERYFHRCFVTTGFFAFLSSLTVTVRWLHRTQIFQCACSYTEVNRFCVAQFLNFVSSACAWRERRKSHEKHRQNIKFFQFFLTSCNFTV